MPVIRLFLYASSRADKREVRLNVRLRPEWTLAACFPISMCQKQEVSWRIAATTTGELMELERQSAVPYLFYETLYVKHQRHLSCALIQFCRLNARLPSSTDLFISRGGHSVLHDAIPDTVDWLPTKPNIVNGSEMERGRAVFIEYIEQVLTNVFLFDCRQRTDLITSLLANITYERVLFRFLSKDEIDSAAAITIQPSMLYHAALSSDSLLTRQCPAFRYAYFYYMETLP